MRLIKMLLGVMLLAMFALAAQEKAADNSGSKQTDSKKAKPTVEKKTPFGTFKYEQKADEPKEEPSPEMRAYDEGDTVRFERKTPFGVSKWKKKRSELDEMEKAALERERRKPAKQ